MKKFYLLFIISALIFMGCNGQSAKKETSTTPSVYMAGTDLRDEGGFAVYWKDGIKTELYDGEIVTTASSIAVLDNTIYVTGSEFINSKYVACYWKNGKKTMLVPNGEASGAYWITTSGNDIYIAGYKGQAACYWKNGEIVLLSDGSVETIACSIAISGSDVIVAGYEISSSGYVAYYWKNGQKHHLESDGKNSLALEIYISGKDIYISGDYIEVDEEGDGTILGRCWKNGKIINFTDVLEKKSAEHFFASDGDLYSVSGTMVLKNKVLMSPLDVPEIKDYWDTSEMFVFGSDIYVAGTVVHGESTSIILWKNGKISVIETVDHEIEVTSIVVQ